MTPTERDHLRGLLAEQLDEQAATTLMESLPPMDWHELARKDDVFANREAIEANREAIEGLRHDVGDVKYELGVLRHELTASFRGELVVAVGAQSRHMIVGMVSSVVAMGSFALALQQLG